MIRSNDHGPAHVHVFEGDGEAKINLDPIELMQVWKMKRDRLLERRRPSSRRTVSICCRGGKRSMENRAFDREYENAKRAAVRADRIEPRARSARYDRRTNRIVVELRNGASFMFPAELAEGLAGASPKDLADVQVTPSGAGLRWPSLDADLSLPNLLAGEFGSKRWMAKLGRNDRPEVTKEEPQRAGSRRRSKG